MNYPYLKEKPDTSPWQCRMYGIKVYSDISNSFELVQKYYDFLRDISEDDVLASKLKLEHFLFALFLLDTCECD